MASNHNKDKHISNKYNSVWPPTMKHVYAVSTAFIALDSIVSTSTVQSSLGIQVIWIYLSILVQITRAHKNLIIYIIMGDKSTLNQQAIKPHSNIEINSQLHNTMQSSSLEKSTSQSTQSTPPTLNDLIISQDNQIMNIVNNRQTNINLNISNPKSFTDTAATHIYPKMSQTIVLTTIDDLKQIDYLSAIGKLTAPINIISASRISNIRFCIFLNT